MFLKVFKFENDTNFFVSLSKPLHRPPSSAPSGATIRPQQARDNPSEASYYQAAPSNEPLLQPSRANPSQKLPEAPWPNPQPPILASVPQKPQHSTPSQPERCAAAIEEGLIHLGSIHGGSSNTNTPASQGRGLSSTQLPADNFSPQQLQANNGKSKVGRNGDNHFLSFLKKQNICVFQDFLPSPN